MLRWKDKRMAGNSLTGLTLHVKDVEQSLEFYKKIPDARVIVHRPGHFALMMIGKGQLGLLRHDEGKFHVEIDTPSLEAMHDALCANGLKPETPPEDRSWGQRDFLLIDPDGNMLEFGSNQPGGDTPNAEKWQKP